jgi:hypothetical protein
MHKSLNIFRLTSKAFSQLWILSANPERTGALVAFAKQSATKRYQSSSTKTESLGTEQGRNNNISAGFDLAINLNPDPTS